MINQNTLFDMKHYNDINYINEYPDITATTTLRIIESLNAMLRET